MNQISKEAKVIQALFMVQNKQGLTVPFQLNPSQYKYDIQKTSKDLIPKARQKGFSTYKVAEAVADCLGIEGTRAVLISHEAGATQRLLDKAQFFLKHIKGPKPVLGRNSRNELYFPKTESTYYIGTAGARAFGRGDTITNLHISEYAWWEGDSKKHVAGLMQAVPSTGKVSIESTGNGQGNDFYYMIKHFKELGYNIFFRSWWEDDEYSQLAPENWQPSNHEEFFEKLRLKLPQLSEDQLFWYYNKLLEFRGDERLLMQEYPSVLEECFQATGHSVYVNIPYTENKNYTTTIYEGYRVNFLQGHPVKDYTYILGADPSGGTFNDDAAIEGVCLETLEEVCSFNLNSIDPVAFSYLLIHLGFRFNEAYLIPEANNHGAAVIPILRKSYNCQKIYKRNIPINKTNRISYGFINNETSKRQMLGASLEVIELGLQIYNEKTKEEFSSIQEIDSKIGSSSDNLWIAMCLACVGVKKYYNKRQVVEETKPKIQFDGNFVVKFEDIFNKNRKEFNRLNSIQNNPANTFITRSY
jgi:hypothetical protein